MEAENKITDEDFLRKAVKVLGYVPLTPQEHEMAKNLLENADKEPSPDPQSPIKTRP